MIITLKDGSTKEYSQPMSVIDIAKDISEGLARAACVAEVNGETVDLRTVMDKDRYYRGWLNGPKASGRVPTLQLTFSVPNSAQ